MPTWNVIQKICEICVIMNIAFLFEVGDSGTQYRQITLPAQSAAVASVILLLTKSPICSLSGQLSYRHHDHQPIIAVHCWT